MPSHFGVTKLPTSDKSLLDVSEDLLFAFNYVSVVLSNPLSVTSVMFNVINVLVFVKMGFGETTSVSLMSLSVADIGVLLMMVAYGVLFHPWMLESVDSDLIDAINYIPLAPRLLLEDLGLPDRLHRPREIRVRIFASLFIGTTPAFFVGPRFNSVINKTTVVLIPAANSYVLENISLSVNILAQISAFVMVTTLTIATIQTYLRKSKWRKATSSSAKSDTFSSRDRKLVKMVTLISVFFITCSFPAVVGTLAMLGSKDYNVNGRYRNLFLATFSVFFHLESFNSTSSSNACHSLKEVFEPSELERGHFTDAYNAIRLADFPDGFQLRRIPVKEADDAELEEEADWIYKQAFATLCISQQNGGECTGLTVQLPVWMDWTNL
ncbi:hypothetical protein Btru_064005 [Bulinus truncatus]|nr:hypothetical protein Btru_064005 [Bulinus truncatus]